MATKSWISYASGNTTRKQNNKFDTVAKSRKFRSHGWDRVPFSVVEALGDSEQRKYQGYITNTLDLFSVTSLLPNWDIISPSLSISFCPTWS